MNHAILLACGNPLRGDDGVAVHLARQMEANQGEPGAEILCSQQWTPELAERISHADLAIFVDASAAIPPGQIQVQSIEAAAGRPGATAHSVSPAHLLALAEHVYGHAPQRAFLVSIGAASFAHDRQLSAPVREAIPAALARIQALLADASLKGSPSQT
ncbi:MAG TPA: hydrogenase maturation protease [Candidatus Limnocylindrales bacterium]|nr:hydrogenase maturation protease [Candidatus Limnocylindrales bacterium]